MLQGCVPWPEDVARLYRDKGYWQGLTIADVFERLAVAAPEREAVFDGTRRTTLGALWDESGRLATAFARLGLALGDRVVFQLPNTNGFLAAFLALMRIGVIPVMALPPHRRTEILHFAQSSGAVALFIPDTLRDFDYRPMAEEIRAELPGLRHVVVLGSPLPGQSAIPAMLAEPADAALLASLKPAASEVALMLLSGGTTALPKLIPRTHDDYVYNFQQSARIAGFGPETVLMGVLPMAHNYTLGSPGVLGALALGGRVVLSAKLDAATIFGLVESERVTAIPAAVPLVVQWLNAPESRDFDTTSLTLVQNGGARLSPELRRRLREAWGCRFQEVYGTAEGLLNMTRLDDPDTVVLESSGAPICDDDEIKVVDIEDREVPDGQPGELLVRGPYTIRGYYDAPAVNARSFTADGFYRMGDVVKKHGRVVSTEGRKKDLINRGGEKIASDEVENLILKHPAVEGVAVVGMPDPVFGEKACAFVTLQPKTRLPFPELQTFLLGQGIAKFKLPERLEILPEFPLSPAGKILRKNLREMIEAKLDAETQGNAR